jgi:gamma-glutamyl-gamma-aminobutyrate hydrolase PuuD
MSLPVYVVGGAIHYTNWLRARLGATLVNTIEEAKLVMFTGGEDVSPELYHSRTHRRTYCNPDRDAHELIEFTKAYHQNKHMIGICRGAQFLCVMSGGMLVQDQQNPNYIHRVSTRCNKEIKVTSTHHQAMFPWFIKNKWTLLAWTMGISRWHDDADCNEMVSGKGPAHGREVEIAHFSHTKCLGIQGHPEMVAEDENFKPFIDYVSDITAAHINGEI